MKKCVSLPAAMLVLFILLGLSSVATAHRGSWGSSGHRGYGLIEASRGCRGYYNCNRRPRNAIDIVNHMINSPFNVNTLLRQQYNQLLRSMERWEPQYEIVEFDEQGRVVLTFEVPGVCASDLSVEVENGNVLRVSGHRSIHQEESSMKSHFEKIFEIESDIDIDNLQVTLSSGILQIAVPKKTKVIRRIPITIEEIELEAKQANNLKETKKKPKNKTPEETRKSKNVVKKDDLSFTEEDSV